VLTEALRSSKRGHARTTCVCKCLNNFLDIHSGRWRKGEGEEGRGGRQVEEGKINSKLKRKRTKTPFHENKG